MLNQDRIALVQATSLTMNDTELLSCTGPVDVELDLASGTATFSKGSAGQLTLFGADPQPRLLNSKQTLQWVPPAGLREQLAETIADVDRMPATNGPATIGPTTNRPTTIGPKKTDSSQSTAGKLRTIETDLNCEIRSALAIRVGSSMSGAIVLGTSDSCRAVRIDPNGKLHPLWKIASAEPIDALTSTGNRSGSPAVVFGSSGGAVVAVNSNGQELWRHQLTSSSAIQRRISCLASGDVDRDGRDELLVGTHSWNVHCLADDGRELWRQPAYAHRIASLAVGDINDDGAADVLVGTSYYVLSAFDGKGDIQFGCRGEPEWRRVIVADLDGDGQPEIAAANGCEVIVLDLQQARIKPRTYTKGMNLPRATTERFRFDTGDDVGALEVADLDHDGQLEIIAASDSGFIYSFDSQGQLLQLRSAGDAVRTLAIGRNEFTEPVIAAGLRDGQILVLDKTLKPLGRGKLHDTPHWLSVSDDGTSVRCATRHSVGLVVLNQSNAN